jgi:hypothetical protein
MSPRIIAAAALATLALSGSAFGANTTLRRTTVVTSIIAKSTVVSPIVVKSSAPNRVRERTNGGELSMVELQSVVSKRAVSLAATTGIARSMSPCRECLKNIK